MAKFFVTAAIADIRACTAPIGECLFLRDHSIVNHDDLGATIVAGPGVIESPDAGSSSIEPSWDKTVAMMIHAS